MFDPIEIHGAERTDFYGRVAWDEEEQAISLEYFSEETGEPDGDPLLFGPEEAADLGQALISASDDVIVERRIAAQGKPKSTTPRVAINVHPPETGPFGLTWEQLRTAAQRMPYGRSY